jgi:hypothetical protein
MNGSISLTTGKAYFIQLMDDTEQLAVMTKHLHVVFDDAGYYGADVTFKLTSRFEVDVPRSILRSTRVDLGNGANDPVVRRSDLENVIRQVTVWANSHIHAYTPPATPSLMVRVTASRVVYAV